MTPSQISNSGKEGPQGPPGPQGPAGPAGPDKILSVRSVDSAPVTIQPGISGPGVSALCDNGEFATGGGFRVLADISAPSATWDVETNGHTFGGVQGWAVTIYNTGSKPVSLIASVQCEKLVPPP